MSRSHSNMIPRYSNSPQNPLSGGAQMWMNEAKDYHGEPIGQGDFSKYGHYSKISKFPIQNYLVTQKKLMHSSQLNACGSPPRSWEWPARNRPRAVPTSSVVTLPLVTGVARSPTRCCPWCSSIFAKSFSYNIFPWTFFHPGWYLAHRCAHLDCSG